MKIIVLSDTHGKSYRIDDVLQRNRDYDALLFLGDGLRDFGGKSYSCFSAVKGNCDGFSFFGASLDAPAEQLITLDGYKFLMTHGHTRSVKSGIESAMAYAYERGADVLLYGHTHIADERYYPEGSELCGKTTDRPMYAFNPGSLGEPRGGEPSFGVIEIRNGQILFSHGILK